MRWIALTAVVLALIVGTVAMAHERPIPPPCILLAAQRGTPLPTTHKEARRARWNVDMLALLGDPLAKACSRAVKAEGWK